MGDLVANNGNSSIGRHERSKLDASLVSEGIECHKSNNWGSVARGGIDEVKYQASAASNFGRSYNNEEGTNSTGSQLDFNSSNQGLDQLRESSSSRRSFGLSALGVNLPSSSEVYSFDPWAIPTAPLLPSSQQVSNSNNSSSSYESFSTSNPSTSIPLTNSYSTLPHPSISRQEHIWSRSNQEQQLALQQRQQREQLQLQLQQQDEWYHQEAYQRQQQEIHRLQQRMEGNRSYSGSAINSNNAYEFTKSSFNLPLNGSVHPFSNTSSVPSLPSSMQQRNSSSFPSGSYSNQRSSSTDSNYLADRDNLPFSSRSQSFSQPQPQPHTQATYSSNYIPNNGTLQDQLGQREKSPGQNIPYLPLPPITLERQNQYPSPTTSSTTSSAPNGSLWNNSTESDYATYLPPSHRLNNSNISPPQSQLPLPPLNRLPPPPPPPSNIFPSPPFLSSHSTGVNTSSTININPTNSNNSRNQVQQVLNHKLRPVVETLRSGLPVVPDRSPFAMWTGNVPGDTTLEELEKYFYNRPGPRAIPTGPNLVESTAEELILESSGVESIHLISRSNCAFINYLTSAHLHHAISTTNGLPLRPLDRRCKPLLCRVRMREDDAKSGVGAQRGGGLHKSYIAALAGSSTTSIASAGTGSGSGVGTASASAGASVSSNNVSAGSSLASLGLVASTPSSTPPVVVVVEGGEGEIVVVEVKEEEGTDDDDGSSGSTSSSSLMRHFPKRFFILKSHNNEELEKSVETGLWSTQSHNESVLDQAYRTAKDGVYFVFSANKSGEWFGYAKMAGPIGTSNEWSPAVSPLNFSQAIGGNTSVQPANSRSESYEKANLTLESKFKTTDAGETAEFAGKPFKVEWIKVQKMPFLRTRHIINSFNSSREVKISRDGTEIEPVAGDQLLRQFWFEPKIRPLPTSSTFNSVPPRPTPARKQSTKPLTNSFPYHSSQ